MHGKWDIKWNKKRKLSRKIEESDLILLGEKDDYIAKHL